MSATNERRHERQLVIRANDLVTGKDAMRIASAVVADALAKYLAAEREDRATTFAALPWWRRFLRGAP